MFDSFPRLIAAFHALHRLLAPRHPPHALMYLATLINCQHIHDTEHHPLSLVTLARKRYRCHLDFIKLSKNTQLFVATRYLSPTCERGSLASQELAVNPSVKNFIFSSSLFQTPKELKIGDDRDRTDNLCLARAALSQLSYVPPQFDYTTLRPLTIVSTRRAMPSGRTWTRTTDLSFIRAAL